MTQNKDQLLNSSYDGIQEYDNALPTWWLWLFYMTIIIGVVYAGWVHFDIAPTDDAALKLKLTEIDAMKAASLRTATAQAVDGKGLLALVKDAKALELGKEVFVSKCMPCHGMNGEGLVGPNLTDDYWVHGGKTTDLRKTIIEGIPAKGMVSWGPILPPQEIDSVVAYIWTMHGTNPANAKAPEGDQITLAEREKQSAMQ